MSPLQLYPGQGLGERMAGSFRVSGLIYVPDKWDDYGVFDVDGRLAAEMRPGAMLAPDVPSDDDGRQAAEVSDTMREV